MSLRRIALPETLTVASLEALDAALDAASSDPEARVWLLHGSASTFNRGMDLSAMSGDGVDASVSLRQFAACLARIRKAPRPTVAVVQGEAMGGGVGILAACDLVLASPEATFALPEALFGLLPGVILPVLCERMPAQKARLMALRGRTHDAAWAREAGLVDEIAPDPSLARGPSDRDAASADLERAAGRAARELMRAAPARVLGLRSWLFELANLEADAALTRGAAVTANLARDPEVKATVRRFVEEGTPPWVGR